MLVHRASPRALQTLLMVCLLLAGTVAGITATAVTSPSAMASEDRPSIPNKRCLKCHNDPDDKTWELDDGTFKNIYIDADQFSHSVHGEQDCVGCHNSIKKAKHRRPLPKSIGCVECHMHTWEAQQGSEEPEYARLDVVIAQIDSYMRSVHARPNLMDQSKTNATCYDCHDAHNIGTVGSAARAEHRQRNPEVCGRCHEEQKEHYLDSVHGQRHLQQAAADPGAPESGSGTAVASPLDGADTATEHAAAPASDAGKSPNPAVCSDCHTPHSIDSPVKDSIRLLITENCGGCHEQQVRTYQASYHGQVIRAGYTHTAKCYDCHGSHGVMDVDDPASKVHPNNRLATCRQCHEDAPEGFLGFRAHGDANDFETYPELWIAKRFMDALIIGVFAFFWTHMLLWIFREWLDRKRGLGITRETLREETVYFRRFSTGWRIAHVVLAVAVMVLVLTGTAVLFSGQGWAQYVINLLGGPKVAAALHRVAAVTFITIFFGHLLVVALNIARAKGRFEWFGPTSLVPNWQDLKDIGRMFKWFIGLAPRPRFDRWSYWEKFDYWAPFWGMFIIGLSGVMLWFPEQTARILPGWVFNIATIVHAEEAILAAVFLFTVHYFNVHFRPDKFPMDIVMATGAVPLAEFKHEHALEYERLKASGELDRYLVKPPTQRATRVGRKITGWLIVIGLVLAVMVLNGYVDMLRQH